MFRPKTLIVLCCALPTLACGSSGGSADEPYAERMAREHAGESPVASGATAGDPEGEVETEDVVYAEVAGQPVTGYLARPVGQAPGAPAVIVIQEWWGLNDNIRAMTRKLAGLGYTALAVDLYRGEVANDAEQARELMTQAMGRESELEDNLRQARDWLGETQEAGKVGVIGWCFGGGWSLRAALSMPGRIDAAVIYYGRLVTDPDRLAELDTPILGLFGEEDGGIPVETVRDFEAALEKLGKPVTIEVYAGAHHAFANPSGQRYDAKAAEDAWAKTVAFFDEHLRS